MKEKMKEKEKEKDSKLQRAGFDPYQFILCFSMSLSQLRPKKLERCIRQQGLTGNSYKLLHGDFREMSKMTKEANARPVNFSHDIVQGVQPFHDYSIKKYVLQRFLD